MSFQNIWSKYLELQGIRYLFLRKVNVWKILKQILNVAYPHVVSFTVHEKDIATEVYLEPSQTYILELFTEIVDRF